LISRINRWIIAGAVAATGVISVAAARSFNGHTASSTSSVTQSANSAGSSLQSPTQTPSASSPAPSPPVVSGGS